MIVCPDPENCQPYGEHYQHHQGRSSIARRRLSVWWRRRVYRCCRTWTPHYVEYDRDGALRCQASGRPVDAPADDASPSIDDQIDVWHNGAGKGQELHEYLGMTWPEYQRFVSDGVQPVVSTCASSNDENLSAVRRRRSALTTVQHYRLNEACRCVRRAFDGGGPYLVGTAATGECYRDVDVRTILPDEEWDELFAGRERLWDLLCLSVSQYLADVTGLPVDYQVQRMTEANEKHDGVRHALGLSAEPASRFAGGGDATPPAGGRSADA